MPIVESNRDIVARDGAIDRLRLIDIVQGNAGMSDSFFDLKKRPFLSTPTLDRYFPAEGIEQAYQTLSRVIERAEGPAAIIGGTGLGKSLLCLRVAEAWQSNFDVILLSSSKLCSRRALLQNLLFELRMPYRDLSEGELRLSLMERLQQSDEGASDGLILIIDEAQTLTVKLLEELRLLTNLATAGVPRVRLILAGTLRLDELLAHPRLESLQQRLAARCYLKPLLAQEVSRYIRHKVELCGAKIGSVFTEDAIRAIYRASDGIPRLIDQIADHSLLMAEQQKQRPVSASIIEQAWAEIQQLPAPWTETTNSAVSTSVIEFGSLEDDDSDFESEEFATTHATGTTFSGSEFDLDDNSDADSVPANHAAAFGDEYPVVSRQQIVPKSTHATIQNASGTGIPKSSDKLQKGVLAEKPDVSTRLTAALQAVQIKLNTGSNPKLVPLTPITQSNSGTTAKSETTNKAGKNADKAKSKDELFGGGFEEEYIVGLQSSFSPASSLAGLSAINRGVTEQQFGIEVENSGGFSNPLIAPDGSHDSDKLNHPFPSDKQPSIEDDIQDSIAGFTVDSFDYEEPVTKTIPPSNSPRLRTRPGENPPAYLVRQGLGPNRSHVLSFASLAEESIQAAGDDRDLLIVEEDIPARHRTETSETTRNTVNPQSYIQLFSRLRG